MGASKPTRVGTRGRPYWRPRPAERPIRPTQSDETPNLSGVSVRLRLPWQMRDMTLKGLADAVGCSESMLSKWDRWGGRGKLALARTGAAGDESRVTPEA
jgi:hypothetical protein